MRNSPRRWRIGITSALNTSSCAGSSGGMMLKPSAAPSSNQSSIKLGDLFRRACGDEMAARTGEISEQLPQCRLVAPHQIDDHLGPTARGLDHAGVGKIFWRQRAIERQGRKIVPTKASR